MGRIIEGKRVRFSPPAGVADSRAGKKNVPRILAIPGYRIWNPSATTKKLTTRRPPQTSEYKF